MIYHLTGHYFLFYIIIIFFFAFFFFVIICCCCCLGCNVGIFCLIDAVQHKALLALLISSVPASLHSAYYYIFYTHIKKYRFITIPLPLLAALPNITCVILVSICLFLYVCVRKKQSKNIIQSYINTIAYSLYNL